MFDPQERRGDFNEEDLIEEYSDDYFWALSDQELAKEIESFQKALPKEIEVLDQYVSKHGQRERLVIKAMHLKRLSDACIEPEIVHSLNRMTGDWRL